jgi:hypothetical protein
MITDAVGFDRSRQLRDLAFGLALRSVRDLTRGSWALQQGFEQELTGDPQQIGPDAAPFAIGILQDLSHSVALTRGVVHKLATPARQVP